MDINLFIKIRNGLSLKKRRVLNLGFSLNVTKKYRENHKVLTRNINRSSETKIAVVVHLFYEESWDVIQKNLKNLNKPFDLFISIPSRTFKVIDKIQKDYPLVYIYETPNRGRDVLPFIKILPVIREKGYLYILKIHSKKSTHRIDGNEWMNGMLESLLPNNKQIFNKLINVLDKKDTGLIGPSGQYIQLTVNFEANGVLMTEILKLIYHNKVTVFNVLQSNRTDYGFFAGTMFWARIDSLDKIVNHNFGVYKFNSEAGQIDGTLAHAFERVFCLIPEIDGKHMYEISPDNIMKINYKTNNIPDWSDVYIG